MWIRGLLLHSLRRAQSKNCQRTYRFRFNTHRFYSIETCSCSHVSKINRSNYNMSTETRSLTCSNTLGLQTADRLIWIDMEMTGLNVLKDSILEIACLVTEGDLTLVAEGPCLAIHQDDSILEQMDEWCIQHHGESGLTESVKKSTISTEEAEKMVLEFVQKHTPQGKCPLAGNSVRMDRNFIDQYMPKLAEHMHYRIVDVSSIKELCRRWYLTEYKNAPKKKIAHRAMDDIKESIEELKYYRSVIFR